MGRGKEGGRTEEIDGTTELCVRSKMQTITDKDHRSSSFCVSDTDVNQYRYNIHLYKPLYELMAPAHIVCIFIFSYKIHV